MHSVETRSCRNLGSHRIAQPYRDESITRPKNVAELSTLSVFYLFIRLPSSSKVTRLCKGRGSLHVS